MLVVDNGDAIRGIAEVASKLDFTVNGFVGTTPTQLADGQLSNAETDMYLSGANSIVVASITVTNTDSVTRTFTLYLKPSAGTARAISPVSLDLGIGHSFYTDGQRMVVMDATGQILNGWTVDDTAGGTDGLTTVPISTNAFYDHIQAADPHTGYLLESFVDAKGDLISASADNTPLILTVGTNGKFLEAASGEATGLKWSIVATTFSALTDVELVRREDEDQVVNNSTTLVNDTYLLFAMAANEAWFIKLGLLIDTSMAADFNFGFAMPVGATLDGFSTRIRAAGTIQQGTIIESTTIDLEGGNVGVPIYQALFEAMVINGGNAGNFQLQWAQKNAEVSDTKLLTNSFILAYRLT